MAAVEELFAKFKEYWRSGIKARLSFEFPTGQVLADLHIHLLQAPSQQEYQQHRREHRHVGPSPLHRHAWRAAARANAAVKAAVSIAAEKENDNEEETMIEPIVDNGSHPEAEQAADQSEIQHKSVLVATQPNSNDNNDTYCICGENIASTNANG